MIQEDNLVQDDKNEHTPCIRYDDGLAGHLQNAGGPSPPSACRNAAAFYLVNVISNPQLNVIAPLLHCEYDFP